MHELNPSQSILDSVEGFEPLHRTRDPLYYSMVLLHDIIKVLHLADDDRGAVLCVIAANSRSVGRAPIDSDLLRHPVTADGLGEEALGGLFVALLGA